MEWFMIWTMLILFLQTSILLVRKFCCMCLKTTKQWSRWSQREESLQWDTRTYRVALDWLIDTINLDPKIQIKYIDTKTNSQTYRPRKFHTWWMESSWKLKCCRKETQEDAGERVTTKSKPMMNLVSRCSVRDPNVLASTASESSVKPDMKVTYLWARGMSSNQERWDFLRTLTHEVTQSGMLTKMVFSRVEIRWNVGSKNGETCWWTTTRFVRTAHRQICCWSAWYGL